MSKWYINELSKLTNVSVRTLHHYDRIGLLEPSLRLDNGYRLYSETDLLKMQQIIALKYFGFKLSQIQKMLEGDVDVMNQLQTQSHFLKEKMNALQKTDDVLRSIIADNKKKQSIPWKKVIKSMEAYHMTNELEKTWAGKVLNPEELQEYAEFEQGLKSRYTEQEKEAFSKEWAELVEEVKRNLKQDPSSELGMDIGKRCMERVNKLYGEKHAGLKNSIWEKGYKEDKMGEEHSLPKDVVAWLDKAVSSYYRGCLLGILERVGSDADKAVKQDWEKLLKEMHGENDALNQNLYEVALNDSKVSPAAKQWIKDNYCN